MLAVPVTLAKVAVMFEVPPEIAVATPPLEMLAMLLAEEAQVTEEEMSLLVPSL
jgi:hypothetical protein